MRALKIVGTVLAVLVAVVVGLWLSPFSLNSAEVQTQAHGRAQFSRGPGGTGGKRPIRFSVEGDPELVSRVTKALAAREGFRAGGAASLQAGEALAMIQVKAHSRWVTPLYAHSQVHLHAALASDGRLVETEPLPKHFTPALWGYPVVRGEYELDLEGTAKGLVSASAYFDGVSARLADEVASQLQGALVGDGVSVARLEVKAPVP